MAPKRKRNSEPSSTATTAAARSTRSAARTATRATRSATSRGDAALNLPVDNPEPRRSSKKQKTTATTTKGSGGGGGESSSSGAAKTILIEYCKHSAGFEERAGEVMEGLEKASVNVVVNKWSPRKGCFEVREEDGDTFVSLLNLESPFEPLMELDLGKVVSDIVQKLK